MRIESWEKSLVAGSGENGKHAEEMILHRRGADPMVLAFRRNPELAGCDRIAVHTEEVFTEFRMSETEIGRDIRKERNKREWEWIGGGKFAV